MILENDQKIAKSPPLFKKYARGTITAQDPSNPRFGTGAPPAGDSMYNQSPETSMALQQMSYLVLPIARNIIAAQTLLDDEKLLAPTGNPTDDATLAKIKSQLLETVAYQSASLDIINGFVETLQMGEIQHAGEEYLGAIQGSDTTTQLAKATPNQWQDPNAPGSTSQSVLAGSESDSGINRRLQPNRESRRRVAVAARRDRNARGHRRQDHYRGAEPMREVTRLFLRS